MDFNEIPDYLKNACKVIGFGISLYGAHQLRKFISEHGEYKIYEKYFGNLNEVNKEFNTAMVVENNESFFANLNFSGKYNRLLNLIIKDVNFINHPTYADWIQDIQALYNELFVEEDKLVRYIEDSKYQKYVEGRDYLLHKFFYNFLNLFQQLGKEDQFKDNDKSDKFINSLGSLIQEFESRIEQNTRRFNPTN